jgi:predicted dehydrogenase
MRIALVGDNLDVLPFLTTLVDSGRHELVGSVLAPRCARELRGVPSFDSWQDLVPDHVAETVLIADGSPDVQEAARQLAALDKRLLVWPTAGMSSEFVYQLTLIHAEQRLVLLPLLPLRVHPAVEELRGLLRAKALGRVQHLRLDAALRPLRGTGFTPRQMAERFLADVDLLRSFGGEYDRISASRSADDDLNVHLATATLTGETCPQAMWSLTAAPNDAWVFTVAGERGTLTLSASGDPLACNVQQSASGIGITQTHGSEAGWDERLTAQCDALQTGAIALPSWSDLAQLFELREAFDRSHERARTIDLHFDTPSERAVFKSQMAAAGCSVLIFTLLAVILFLGISAAMPLPPLAKHVLPWVIFAPLGVYLLLQLLILLTRAPASDAKAVDADRESRSIAG